jgi:hypothetical protein
MEAVIEPQRRRDNLVPLPKSGRYFHALSHNRRRARAVARIGAIAETFDKFP